MQTAQTTLRPWTLPPSYSGARWDGYLVAPCTQNRDSSTLEESNFAAQWAALAGTVAELPDSEEYSPIRVRESHFLCGWVEWVAVHPSNAEAVRVAERLAKRLENYPVLSEDDFSNREWVEYVKAWVIYGARDFVRELASVTPLSDRAADTLADWSGLQALYESGIPSGDYQELDGTRIRNSADRLTRDEIATALREARAEKRDKSE